MRRLFAGGLALGLLACAAAAPADDWRPVGGTPVSASPVAGSGSLGITLQRPIPTQSVAEPKYDTQVRPVTYSPVRIGQPMPTIRAKADMPRPLPSGDLPVGQVIAGEPAELRSRSEQDNSRPSEMSSVPCDNGYIVGQPGPMSYPADCVPLEGEMVPYGDSCSYGGYGDAFLYGSMDFGMSDSHWMGDSMFCGEAAMLDSPFADCGGYPAPYTGLSGGMCGSFAGPCCNYGAPCCNSGPNCNYGGGYGNQARSCVNNIANAFAGNCAILGGGRNNCNNYGNNCQNPGNCGPNCNNYGNNCQNPGNCGPNCNNYNNCQNSGNCGPNCNNNYAGNNCGGNCPPPAANCAPNYSPNCGTPPANCANPNACNPNACNPNMYSGNCNPGYDNSCEEPRPWLCLFKKWHNCHDGSCQNGPGPGAGYGPCDSRFGCRRPYFWMGGEWLNWRLSDQNLPTLVVSTSDPAQVLYNQDTLNQNSSHGGARGYLGFWCANNPCVGFDVNWFYLSRENQTSTFNGAAIAFIPGPQAFGVIGVASSQYMWGIDANMRKKLQNRPNYYCDLLIGYRHIQLDESLSINAGVAGAAPGFADSYRTANRFNGGQIGFDSEYRFLPKWLIGGTVKVAFGNTHQTLRVQGTGNLLLPLGTTTLERNAFAIVPEAQVRLVHELSERWRIHVGYNLLGISSVVRPGDAVSTTGGTPAVLIKDESIIAHGINVGLTCTY